MALLIIGVLTTSLSVFFVRSTALMAYQRSRQAAVQLADGAVERVRALPGPNLTDDRNRVDVEAQWASPVPGTAGYLAGLVPAYDVHAHAGRTPTMPLTEPVTLNGVAYTRHAYLGRCWQSAGDTNCVPSPLTDGAALLRVVIAITWSERICPQQLCSYVTATLVSIEPQDPMFNANEEAGPPTLAFPGTQLSRVGLATTLRVAVSGGTAPLTWTFTDLPPGLSVDATGSVTGTPTQAYDQPVTVRVSDGFNLTDQITFQWVVSANPASPVLADPGPQTTQVQHSVRLPMALAGGTTPLTWTAAGMPPGLTISGTTGLITGFPTTTGSFGVTVSVTDTRGLTSTTSFTWTVTTAMVSQSYFNAMLAEPLLVGYFRLGETGGASAVDSSGNGWTGTYVGGPLFGRIGAIPGDADTAVELTGVTGVVLDTRHDFIDTSQFSLEAWVNPSSLGSGEKTILRKWDGGANGWGLTMNATDGFVFTRQSSTGTDTAVSGPVTTGHWYHVVASYDSTNMDLYVDNVLKQRTPSSLLIGPSAAPLHIGFSPNVAGSGFVGLLDEVAVYARANSAADVDTRYRAAGV